MPIRLPSTGNIHHTDVQPSQTMHGTWGFHEGRIIDYIEEAHFNWNNIGTVIDNNSCFFRANCAPGLTLLADHSFAVGAALPVTNDGRRELPVLLGITGHVHSVPKVGTPLEDFSMLLLAHVRNFIATGNPTGWVVVTDIPMNISSKIDGTHNPVYDYSFEHVLTVIPKAMHQGNTEYIGLMAAAMCWHNSSSDTAYDLEEVSASVGMTVSYGNRRVYDPEIF